MADVQLPVADLVESATHELMNGQPNWSANMQIADIFNAQPQQVPLLLSCLKKRLSHKSHSVGLLAVILLESCVKNAPRPLLPLIGTSEFMSDLVSVLPRQVRDPAHKSIFSSLKDYTRDIQACERFDKILLCIESWSRVYGSRYPAFAESHRQLQRNGVKFPAAERDELAPVVTPPVSAKVVAEREEEKRRSRAQLEQAERARQRNREDARRSEVAQLALRLRDADARAAVEMAQLLTDTLTQTSPGEDLRANELVTQIWSALKPASRRLQDRLTTLAAAGQEETLAEVLQANDVCMDAALYYEGLVKGTMQRRVVVSAAPTPVAASSQDPLTASARAPAATSPQAAPATAATASSPTDKKAKAVPLLQPPPGTASGASSSPARRKSSAASPIAAPPVDLLFTQPTATATATSTAFGGPVIPPTQPQHQHGARSPFSLPPPPAAVDFFAPPASSASAAATASVHSAATAATPFDDDDPFLALATRSSPTAADERPAASHSAASSNSTSKTPQRAKSVVEEFDLLQF